MDSNLPSTMVTPLVWPEMPLNSNRQHYQQQWQFDAFHQPLWGREEDNHNFTTPENSLLSYNSSANSGRSEFSFYCACLISKYMFNIIFSLDGTMVPTATGFHK